MTEIATELVSITGAARRGSADLGKAGDVDMWVLASNHCHLCAIGTPHHTNARSSIGGEDRHPIYDLHAVEDSGGVGLAECLAGDLWLAWERARQ